MKITIVAGARPNFMKIAPITRAIEAARALGKSISYRLVYTGRKTGRYKSGCFPVFGSRHESSRRLPRSGEQ